jgi:hypothetical protein
MRALRLLTLAVTLAGCGGSLVEHWDAGVEADGGTTGLECVANDPCTCAPCTSTTQCTPGLGLTCMTARRKGMDCPGGLTVCTTGQ